MFTIYPEVTLFLLARISIIILNINHVNVASERETTVSDWKDDNDKLDAAWESINNCYLFLYA